MSLSVACCKLVQSRSFSTVIPLRFVPGLPAFEGLLEFESALVLERLLWSCTDLKAFTRKVEVSKDRIPTWPHDQLTVLAESASIFYDLMTEAMVDQV